MKHILRFEFGVVIEGTLCEDTGAWSCVWSPPPPYPIAWQNKIGPEYEKWRDGIIRDYAIRTGKNILVVTL